MSSPNIEFMKKHVDHYRKQARLKGKDCVYDDEKRLIQNTLDWVSIIQTEEFIENLLTK